MLLVLLLPLLGLFFALIIANRKLIAMAYVIVLFGSSGTFAADKTVVVGSSAAGGFKIGMTKAQIKLTRKPVIYGEDVNGGCVEARVKNQPITLMLENNIVTRIYLTDPSYITAKRIHLGSTEQSAIAAYGTPLKIEPHHYDQNGHYLTLFDRKGFGLRFETDGKVITTFSIGKKPAIEYVEGCL